MTYFMITPPLPWQISGWFFSFFPSIVLGANQFSTGSSCFC
jgi:hypothetical protein